MPETWSDWYKKNGRWSKARRWSRQNFKKGEQLALDLYDSVDDDVWERLINFDIPAILGSKWYHQVTIAPGVVIPGTFAMKDSFPSLGFSSSISGKRILDLGCADGTFSVELAKMGADVVGVDAFDIRIRHAEFLAALHAVGDKIEFICDDISNIEEEIGTFDYIVMSHVLCHYSPSHRRQITKTLSKLLRESGVLVLNTNTKKRDLRTISTHFSLVSENRIHHPKLPSTVMHFIPLRAAESAAKERVKSLTPSEKIIPCSNCGCTCRQQTVQ